MGISHHYNAYIASAYQWRNAFPLSVFL
ncbi:uncharacterized protein METZ01_LOCUS337154, partial [marine metagenome]